jgi:broad specificity phosphatase PhoE
MGSIYVVRHGQAAFGTDDYDRLTDTGFAQAHQLGAYFERRNLRFAAVYTGTLRRHMQTAEAIFAGNKQGSEVPGPESVAGLNEYNVEAVLVAFAGATPPFAASAGNRDPAFMRDHFRSLKAGLLAWSEGRIAPAGMPSWMRFQADAVTALVSARQRFPDGNVLVVSSGGPISAIVAAALGAPPATAIELNMRLRNCSLTEFASSSRRHSLVSFNALPHLEPHFDPALVTYA